MINKNWREIYCLIETDHVKIKTLHKDKGNEIFKTHRTKVKQKEKKREKKKKKKSSIK
jgi:hypothetical protein